MSSRIFTLRPCFLLGSLLLALARPGLPLEAQTPAPAAAEAIPLPQPRRDSSTSVEKALASRRSVRQWTDSPLRLEEISQLLWAAQGITGPEGRRTAPSAGALYPLEIYLLAGQVAGLSAGVYRYQPGEHRLALVQVGDQRIPLAQAALEQRWICQAPAVFLIAAVPQRTRQKYGERSGRYIAIEVGHAAQNVYLQAQALGLGTVAVGAFGDDQVKQVAGLRPGEEPFLLLPIGRRSE